MSAYSTRHERVRKVRGKASEYPCACGKPAQEWATLHGTDGESPDDYQAMCCSCHQKYDDHWSAETRAKVGRTAKAVWANTPEVMANSLLNGYKNRGRSRPDMIGNTYRADAAKRSMEAGDQS